MKKIYNYLLPLLLSLVVFACDDKDDNEVTLLTVQDPVVTVTKISPEKGFEGNEFTVFGTNFGIIADDVEVFLGSTKLELISCEDEKLTVRVPEGATADRVSVVVYGQRVDTKLTYDVLGEPGITSIHPVYGFIGDQITFNGHDLGVSSTFYKVMFNEATDPAQLMSEPKDDSFMVKVPKGAKSGKISLVITDKKVGVSQQFTVLEHATLENLSSEQGFTGSQLTISGTHLMPEIIEKEGLELDGIKVFFEQQEKDPVEAEIVGEPTDGEVTIKVPESLEQGEYKIAVSTSFEKIEKKLAYTVLPMPKVTGLSTSAGYVNAQVVIQGENFGTKAEDIQVLFGETACSNVTLNEDGNIVVNVPKGVEAGMNTIKLVILDTEISMGDHSQFEVWQTPEIISVKTSYMYSYGTLVKPGDEITFIGHDFGTSGDAVTVTFEGVTVPVSINSISPTAIAVTVPEGFNGGKVAMAFENIDEPVLSGELAVVPEDGDITQYVLKNSVQPFKGHGFIGSEWDSEGLHDWEKTNIQNGGGLQYPKKEDGSRDSNGCIALHQWGKRNNHNGKMWQKTKLPKGTYTFELDGISIDINNGHVNAAFVVCEGTTHTALPNYENGVWKGKQPGVKGEISMAAKYKKTKDAIDVTLEKETDLVVGFVVWAHNTVWATFNSVKVYLK